MKIYTKTGDEGKTSLFGGTRVSKYDARIEAYGMLDELNAHIGLLRINCKDYRSIVDQLHEVQSVLFVLGSHLAADNAKENDYLPEIPAEFLVKVEAHIDEMSESLEPLKNFILPGGSLSIAQTHICRTICRKAERRIVECAEEVEVDKSIIPIMNRLSDYFFTLARYLAHKEEIEEIKWINPASS